MKNNNKDEEKTMIESFDCYDDGFKNGYEAGYSKCFKEFKEIEDTFNKILEADREINNLNKKFMSQVLEGFFLNVTWSIYKIAGNHSIRISGKLLKEMLDEMEECRKKEEEWIAKFCKADSRFDKKK